MKKIVFFALMVFTMAFSFAAHASSPGTFWVEINGTSLHGSKTYVSNDGQVERYNGANYGLGVRYAVMENVQVFGGFYRNSYDKTSVYLGTNLKLDYFPVAGWRVSPGVKLGVASGYKGTPEDEVLMGAVVPMVLPNVEVGHDGKFVNLAVLPPIGKGRDGVMMIQFGVQLN